MLNAFDGTTVDNSSAPLYSFIKCQLVSIRSSQCFHIGMNLNIVEIFLLNFKQKQNCRKTTAYLLIANENQHIFSSCGV